MNYLLCLFLLSSISTTIAFNRIFHKVQKTAAISLIVTSSLLTPLVVNAELGDESITTAPSVVNAPKAIGVRTIESKNIAPTNTNTNDLLQEGDKSYKSSLEKEMNKAKVQSKKTKEEKRRDLCEALGRGC